MRLLLEKTIPGSRILSRKGCGSRPTRWTSSIPAKKALYRVAINTYDLVILDVIERVNEGVIWATAGQIPPEWYEGDWGGLESLIKQLLGRRSRVRELINAFRFSPRRPFPNWRE